jgi:hypothetical protein
MGLKNLNDRMNLIMNKGIDIIDDDESFTVKLPLLKISTA